jgi:hypothetical protein
MTSAEAAIAAAKWPAAAYSDALGNVTRDGGRPKHLADTAPGGKPRPNLLRFGERTSWASRIGVAPRPHRSTSRSEEGVPEIGRTHPSGFKAPKYPVAHLLMRIQASPG